jgi:hypothetical protein
VNLPHTCCDLRNQQYDQKLSVILSLSAGQLVTGKLYIGEETMDLLKDLRGVHHVQSDTNTSTFPSLFTFSG